MVNYLFIEGPEEVIMLTLLEHHFPAVSAVAADKIARRGYRLGWDGSDNNDASRALYKLTGLTPLFVQ